MSARANAIFRYLVVLLLVLPAQPLLADSQHTDSGHGLLFHIQKQDGPDSWLFGSIHSDDPRVLDFSKQLKAALTGSELFVMEARIDDPSRMMQALTGMWLTDGRTLADVVGDALYTDIIGLAETVGLPQASLTFMKPWVVMMLFSLPPGDYQQILDLRLMRLAQSRAIPVMGLETIDEQFAVFEGMPVEDLKLLLKATLDNYPQLENQFEKLMQAYLQRDLQQLHAIAVNQLPVDGATAKAAASLMQRLVEDRNQRMVERLQPVLGDNNCFVVVGALHLPGESGLISQLRQIGFSVTAIE